MNFWKSFKNVLRAKFSGFFVNSTPNRDSSEIHYCFKCMKPLGSDGKCKFCGPYIEPERDLNHLQPGTLLWNNRLIVGNCIGQGGFGITYIGLDTHLQRRVAIKEYYPRVYVSRSANDNKYMIITKKMRPLSLSLENKNLLKRQPHLQN